MSGDKILNVAMETKEKCDDTDSMNSHVQRLVNDGNIKETFANTNHSCCSSSCCNYNSVVTSTKEATTITTTSIKTTENTKEGVKTSESTGKILYLNKYTFDKDR